MESTSRFDYLLKALEISGKEISKALDIDETTISKWRKNQRRLTYKNKHVSKIADILLASEVEQKRRIVENILKRRSNDLNLQSRQQKIDALRLWLTEAPDGPEASGRQVEAYSPKNGYNTSVSIFVGEEGIDEAIHYFMNYLTFVGVWNTKKYKKSLYCIHIDVISGFYRYIEDIWNAIPSACKDPDWKNKQLDRLTGS